MRLGEVCHTFLGLDEPGTTACCVRARGFVPLWRLINLPALLYGICTATVDLIRNAPTVVRGGLRGIDDDQRGAIHAISSRWMPGSRARADAAARPALGGGGCWP